MLVIFTILLLLVRKVLFAQPAPLFTFEPRLYFSPTPMVRTPFVRVIFVGALLTVILQDFSLPFTVLAVIHAVPLFTAFTLPFLSTVSTFESDVRHVTLLSAAFDGATVAPSNATNKSVTWRTSDSKVLTVDKKGNVKAVGNGTAWITAKTVNGKEKSCKITVKNAPNKVTISKGVVTIGVGEKFTVGSAVPDGSAAAKRTYRTTNSSIVKMTRTDWQGDFVGVKPGTAYVTVRTYNGKESTCKVTVKAAPSSVTISKKTMTMKVGQTATLSCSVPSDAGCATRTYRTSNSSVVKMTKTSWTGTFKALKKGTAYVTVRTYNGKESSCKIEVK